jgi:hypothetical protein
MGIGAATLAGALSLLVEMASVIQRVGDATPNAADGTGLVSAPKYFLYVALIAFVAAFSWQLHRTSR